MSTKKTPKVIIVGAGASGIAAASRLLENGIDDLTILEAENRIGGRIHSVDFDGSTVDLGAQWCHGQKDNIVYALAGKLDLLRSSVNSYDDFTFYDTSGRIVDKSLTDRLLYLSKEIRDDPTMKNYEGSFGQFFIDKYNTDVKECIGNDPNHFKIAKNLLKWLHNLFICLDSAETWFDVSTKSSYTECEGDYYLHWGSKGYKTILNVLMKKIPDSKNQLPLEDKILLNKQVSKISCSDKNMNEQITVECSDGSIYHGDHVITTISLGVLKKQYKNLFNPELPTTKQNAIVGLGFGIVNKILLKFPDWWWPKDSTGFSFLWSDDDVEIISKLSRETTYDMRWLLSVFGFYPVDGYPILVAFVVGPHASVIETFPKNVVLQGCMFALEKCLGSKHNIVPATDVIYSAWSSNPHFCGSYSYRNNKSDELQVFADDLASPVVINDKPLLLFAGEATHLTFYSTVHGAIESGFREADRIIKHYNNRNSLRCKVAIVGAGMAGLGAAKTFIEAGCTDILLLEAQSEPGGRIKTVELNLGILELGAQWIHGSENCLYDLAKKHNLISSVTSMEGLGVYIRDDGYVFDEFLVKKVDFEIGRILEKCEKFVYFNDYPRSVGEFLEEAFLEYIKCDDSADDRELKLQLFDWHVKFQVIDNSCSDLNQLSAKDWGNYLCLGNQGQEHINLKNGYKSLVDVLVSYLPKEKDVLKCNFPVTEIIWKNTLNQVVITSIDDVTVCCDHVILTSSLGCLKQRSSILFKPNLPINLRKSIDFMGFCGIGKIFLVFESKWWSTEGFQLVWRRGSVLTESDKWTQHISGFDIVLNQPNVLLGWVGSAGVTIMENLSEEEVGIHCVQLLRRFLKTDDIPLAKKVLRSRWTSCPWIRGGYSYSTPQCDDLEIGALNLREPVLDEDVPRILLAGEACHPHYFSTTHGAFESGQKQARNLLDFISKS